MLYMEIRGLAYMRLSLAAVATALALSSLLGVGCGGARPAASVETVPASRGVHHPVDAGHTLWRIATAYGLTVDELARANGLDVATPLVTGQRLFVPGAVARLSIPDYPADPRDARSAGGVGELGELAGLAEAAEAIDDPAPRAPDDDAWLWPVPGGRLLSPYGAPRGSRRHRGIDIQGAPGAPVLAALDGRVVYSGSGMRGYGKTVVLDHGNGLRTLYAHNSRLLVEGGETVRRGQTIAHVGRTGNATGPHCHFEMQRNRVAFDPMTVRVARGERP